MTRENDFKKMLREAGLKDENDTGAHLVLEELYRRPQVMSRAEPPPGYEDGLVHALRAKLPLEKRTKIAALPMSLPPRRRFSILDMVGSSGFAWSFSALVVLLGVGSWFNFRDASTNAGTDFIVQTAQNGDAPSVNRWLASVGDSSFRSGQAELEGYDAAQVDQALTEVARNIGMGGI
jgi:hypothetical protein